MWALAGVRRYGRVVSKDFPPVGRARGVDGPLSSAGDIAGCVF